MFTNLALLSLAFVSTGTTDPGTYRPRVELWTNRGDAAVYTRGERVRLYFRLDQDAYVTIFRVDTDGRVRVLFPREPWEDNFARGGRDFEVDGNQLAREAFTIDDYPGVGYLFAVTSADAFVYDGIETGDHWDYRTIADGRVRGDPYVAMTDLAQRIVPDGYTDWDYDVISYNVGQHYDYPRFLCYDCHTYVSYPYWDPYFESCVRFRMYVYDDPWFYPYRYGGYGGGGSVFTRPYRPQPRFIFKDWGTARPNREGFVTRDRERPVNDNTRRGVTGRDVGGIGSIPPPGVRDRHERPGVGNNGGGNNGGGNNGDDNRGRGRRERPDRPDRPDNPNNPDRPDRRDRPDRPDHPDRPGDTPVTDRPMVLPRHGDEPRAEPRQVEPRQAEPRQVEPRSQPRDDARRVEPRNEPRRVEPRNEPRNEPRSQPRNEPRNEPRSEPRRASPPPPPPPPSSPPRNEPEVRRRKP